LPHSGQEPNAPTAHRHAPESFLPEIILRLCRRHVVRQPIPFRVRHE
jgi:hypothetical protein